MPYAGYDWSDVSSGQIATLSIDLGPYLNPPGRLPGDVLLPGNLSVEFAPINGTVPNYLTLLQGAPYLTQNPDTGLVTIANQRIMRPPPARYYLGFICGTLFAQEIELWSRFWSKIKPNSSSN